MDTYQGKCQYCGNEQPIMAESQGSADEIVSGKCDCGASSAAKIKTQLMQRINYIAEGKYSEAFSALPEEQTKMLRQGGCDVLAGNCSAVTFELLDSKVKIQNSGDKIKVKRTGVREETAEV